MIIKSDVKLGTTVGIALIANKGNGKPIKDKPYRTFGHAAIVIRIEGEVKQITGWMPVGDASFDKTVEGKWCNNMDMIDDEEAFSVEFPATTDYTTKLSTWLATEGANKKWKYHFMSKDKAKNCVHAALNALIKEQPIDTVKAGAEKIKAGIKKYIVDKFGEDMFKDTGYLMQVAILVAKG